VHQGTIIRKRQLPADDKAGASATQIFAGKISRSTLLKMAKVYHEVHEREVKINILILSFHFFVIFVPFVVKRLLAPACRG
jgi:hypothetical protein